MVGGGGEEDGGCKRIGEAGHEDSSFELFLIINVEPWGLRT